MQSDTNLVWIDLEMTGLDPNKDAILEIATIITNGELNIIASGPELVIHQSDKILNSMGPWVAEQHKKTGLTDASRNSKISLQDAQEQTLDFIKKYCTEKTALLAGNSVWQDRNFLARSMPKIIEYLHYRLLDVTTVKELVKRWYPHSPYAEFKKREAHRALDDIQGSIEELQHYRKYFFKTTDL
jgi:oligoribonuclease